ncbi:hypothetical protein L1049_026535 [Liquidambar formosana]|uniref:DUF6821 domain-containing protein n=1 Tax=Liquidambar formosana TaxID=63359 RepID=A0AAP0NCX8_LIQFO
MEGEAGEFQDWELLQNPDGVLVKNPDGGLVNSSDTVENLRELEGIEGDSEGMIRSDYFSLDSQKRYARTASKADVSEEGSVESDNPSWIDPGSETRYESKNLGEFWSDSSSDRSDERKFSDFDAKNELGFVENAKSHLGFEGIGEIETRGEDSGTFWSDVGGDGLDPLKFGGVGKEELCFGGYAEKLDGSELFGEENKGNRLIMKFGAGDGNSSGCVEGERHEVSEGNENENVAINEVKFSGEEEKRGVVWWKLPLEFLKYCAFRVSPLWSFSVAAAVVGFVILGRRLYKMKRRSRSLQLKVTVDDKKVSQFMTRAARLNEAFSVVRRVPIIRPSLPAAGVTPWPVMSLR